MVILLLVDFLTDPTVTISRLLPVCGSKLYVILVLIFNNQFPHLLGGIVQLQLYQSSALRYGQMPLCYPTGRHVALS